MNVDLVFLSDNTYGGWVTFTYHLYHALLTQKINTRIVKLRNTCSDGRNFGYGLTFSGRTLPALKMEHSVKLIVATHKKYATQAAELLADKRNAVVIHDHNEVKYLPASKRAVVIRKVNLSLVFGAVFIPHPYVLSNLTPYQPRFKTVWARSVSRIDHDKNTTILLDANRLLPANRKIDIRGFENRIYTRFTVMPKYPEWVQSKVAFPREAGAAYRLLEEARFMVDMSTIKGDGGGSQYTFLEAAEAGACCILHSDWCRIKGEMVPGKNCLVAGDAEELVQVLTRTTEVDRYAIVNRAYQLFKFHNLAKVAKQYIKFLR